MYPGMECRLYSELPGLSCKNKGKLLPKKFTGKKAVTSHHNRVGKWSGATCRPCSGYPATANRILFTPFRHMRLHEPLAGLVPVPDDIVTAGVHRGQQFI